VYVKCIYIATVTYLAIVVLVRENCLLYSNCFEKVVLSMDRHKVTELAISHYWTVK